MNVPREFLQEMLDALKTRGEYEVQIETHNDELKNVNRRLTILETAHNETTGKKKAYSQILEFLKALALVVAGVLLGKAL